MVQLTNTLKDCIAQLPFTKEGNELAAGMITYHNSLIDAA